MCSQTVYGTGGKQLEMVAVDSVLARHHASQHRRNPVALVGTILEFKFGDRRVRVR